MAPRVKRTTKEVEKDTSSRDALDDFGISHGEIVKFKDHDMVNTTMVYSRALYVEKDGSIRLIEGTNGHGRGRSIAPDRIKKLEVGPRGGKKWVPLSQTD
jgi:hypothetical protein